jgi:hypothetical protein
MASTIGGTVAATSYTVERYDGSGTDIAAASCSPVSASAGVPDAFGNFSCADSPGTGTFKYKITARYNTSWTATTGFTNAVSPATSMTMLASAANPSVTGQQVTFTATVTLAPAGTPTGKVEFFDNTVPISGCTAQSLSGSGTTYTATCDRTYSASGGSHSIVAEFLGDGSYPASTSPTITQVVNKASTTTVITSSVNPSVTGQSVTYTATVTANSPGSGTPSGTVNFRDNTTTITGCGAKPLSGGQATCTIIYSASGGNHTQINGVYSSDGDFLASTSANFTQNVNKASTTTVITSSVNPSVFGQSVTFTATVAAAAPGAGTPTVTVNFKDGGSTITGCGAQALCGGQATCSTSSLSVGSHATITAVYSSDGNFNASTSSNFTQQIVNMGIDWTNSLPAGATFSCTYTTITAVTCSVSNLGNGGATVTGMVRLIDASHNAVTNTGSSISVSYTLSGKAGGLTPTSPRSIANGSSVTPSISFTMDNGSSKTATLVATVIVNGATYTVTLTARS